MITIERSRRARHKIVWMLGLIAGGVACGAAVVHSSTIVLLVVGIGLVALVLTGIVLTSPHRERLCRVAAWIGLLAPIALTQARTGADIQSSPLTPLLVAQGLVTGAALAVVLLIAAPKILPLRGPEKWLVGFGLVALASATWSIDALPTFFVAANLVTVYLLLIALMRLQERVGADPVRELARVIHLSLAATLVGLLVAPGAAYLPIGDDPVDRLRGVFPPISPDALGLLCAVGIILLIAGYGPFVRAPRFVNATVLAAEFGMLLLSRTRTGILLLVLGLALYYFLRHGGWRAFVASVLVGLLGFLAFATMGNNISSFLRREQTHQNATSLTGRTELWQEALDAWEHRPLEGYGFYVGHRYGLSALAVTGDTPSNIDSLWVETMLDLGLIGLVTLTGFVVAGARRIFGRRYDSRTPPVVARRCLFLACLLSSFVNPSLQKPSFFLLLFAVLVLAPMPKQASPAVAVPPRALHLAGTPA